MSDVPRDIYRLVALAALATHSTQHLELAKSITPDEVPVDVRDLWRALRDGKKDEIAEWFGVEAPGKTTIAAAILAKAQREAVERFSRQVVQRIACSQLLTPEQLVDELERSRSVISGRLATIARNGSANGNGRKAE